MAAMSARWRFIEGLGEDMLGYIFPRSNAVGVPTASNPSPDDTDRFGCGHSDDGEAAAEAAGDILNDALLPTLPAASRFDQVLVGRYVWSDGTLHRDPTGEGRHGCDDASKAFTPAPDGGAVGVWVLPPGVTEFAPGVGRIYLLRESALGHARHSLRWMSATGQPQGGPGTQTRGVLRGRRRH